MIRTSCAWARTSSRRTTPILHAYPRNPNSVAGNTTNFSLTAQWASPSHTIRRPNSTKPPVGQKAPATPTTIPGPSWLWLEPVIEPFRAYGRVQQRKPYLTQFVSSLVIYFVGDLVAQSIAVPENKGVVEEEDDERGWVQSWSEDRDWARTGRALLIGGISSIPSYKWFLWLSMNFNYSSKILSLTTKVCLSPCCMMHPDTNNHTGRGQPNPLHAHLQLVLLRYANPPRRRFFRRNRRAHQAHCAHQLDQQLQALARGHSLQFYIYSYPIQEYLRRCYCDWVADISELVKSEGGGAGAQGARACTRNACGGSISRQGTCPARRTRGKRTREGEVRRLSNAGINQRSHVRL